MDYTLTDLPNSGERPIVFMDISINDELAGRIYIKLFRDVFPAGVENFIKIAEGNTYRIIKKGVGPYQYEKHTRRSYDDNKFFNHMLIINNMFMISNIY